MKINLHIERLLLDGFPTNSLDGNAVSIALSDELTRLLHASPPSPTIGSALPSVKAAASLSEAPPQAARIGAEVACTLHGALGSMQTSTSATARRIAR